MLIKPHGIAKTINSPIYINDALSHIVDLDKNQKVIEYKNLSDSLSLARRLAENKFASMKFDLSESIIKAKEAELKLKDSELQKSKERQLKFVYMFIVVFGMLFSVFLYFIIKAKHKKEKIQQVYNTEVRISKKVHDEVANEVYNIMTKLEHNKNIENDVLDDLEGIYNKTRDI